MWHAHVRVGMSGTRGDRPRRQVFRVFFPDWRERRRAAVAAACADPGRRAWVAERDGEPIGFVVVALHREDAMGEIHLIAVDPDHRRRDVGAALTAFALDRIEEAGMAVAMVETGGDPGHAAARRLSEHAGFRVLPVARFFKRL